VLQAQKYRGFEQHLAMTVLASWFVAQTKFEWAQEHPRAPKLLQELEVNVFRAINGEYPHVVARGDALETTDRIAGNRAGR